MKQRYEPELTLDDRPQRDVVIEKDEVISMVIDLETMSPDSFYRKYFSERIIRRR